ncbi:MAG: ribulose-phosphate 3-epimerase [Clostridia bacterium]|nr:ribulose-phosphate 3-epimerase [Clostridia bacterium]
MDREILIAPSILSGDFADMGNSVRDLEKWGGDIVHLDVMDGVYVKNITFGMPMVAALRKYTALPFDAHLMITEPENYVEAFCDAGADIVTFHPEASKDPAHTLSLIKAKGKKCGVVFNPDVDIDRYASLFSECDMVVIMTVYAGRGGQKLIPECLDRIRYVKTLLDKSGRDIPVEADGGIGESNARDVVAAGATILVAGSSVYKSSDPTKTIGILKETK